MSSRSALRGGVRAPCRAPRGPAAASSQPMFKACSAMPAAASQQSANQANVDTEALGQCLDILHRACPGMESAATMMMIMPPTAATTSSENEHVLHPSVKFGLQKSMGDAERLLGLGDEDVWTLRRECAQHGLLCFRGVRDMTAEKFGIFMSRWGRIAPDFDATEDGSFECSAPATVAPVVFGNGGEGEHLYADPSWHFDGEDLPWLHSYTALFCVKPPYVGHTTKYAATNRAAAHMPTGARC